MSEDGFEVVDEIIVGDLTDVKEQRQVVPASSNVRVRIAKAGIQATKDKDIKSLKLEIRIVDGIPVMNPETNELEPKYQNKPLFTGIMDLVVWADTTVKDRASKEWWKTKQHQIEFKKFLVALGEDIKSVKINDDFLGSLVGREMLVDIQHEPETSMDESGKRVQLGTFKERLRNWKKAA